MAYSYNETTATNGQTNVAVPFEYIERAYVHVSVDAVLIADGDLTWINANTIELPDPLTEGQIVRVFRLTPADGLIVQAQPGPIDHRQVNKVLRQLLHIIQEAFDSALEARAIAEELIGVLNSVTDLYNAIVLMYNEIVPKHAFIASLVYHYEYNVTVPFPPAQNETIALWKLPDNGLFGDEVVPYMQARMLGAPVENEVRVHLYSASYALDGGTPDPELPLDRVRLGSFICEENTYEWHFERNNLVTGDVPLPAGTFIMLEQDDTNSRMEGYTLVLRLQRTL